MFPLRLQPPPPTSTSTPSPTPTPSPTSTPTSSPALEEADVFNHISIFHVAEGVENIGQFTLSGIEHSHFQYSLSGRDTSSFDVSSEGFLTFINAPDYETQNIFSLIVSAETSGQVVNKNILVSVTDLAEEEGGDAALFISSAAFKDRGEPKYTLPLSYTCEGVNGGVSPLLTWENVPESARSVVVAMFHEENDQANFTV